MYEVKGKVLYDNIQFVLDMMNEIIYKTKFSDYKRLKEIIAKLKSRMESTMTSAGHSTAMLAGMAQFSRNAYYSNEMRGYGFYELIQKLDSQFDELKEDIADKLSKLVDYIFHKENIDIQLLWRISCILNHDFFRDLSDTISLIPPTNTVSK